MMKLHALVLGVDNFSALLQVQDYFAQVSGTVSLDARFVALEGEDPTVQQAGSTRRVPANGYITLPDANEGDIEWAQRFERAKFWVRRQLGHRALIGWAKMDELAPFLPPFPGEGGVRPGDEQRQSDLFRRLATFIRGDAEADAEACYTPTDDTDIRAAEAKALIKDFRAAGDTAGIIADMLAYLDHHTVLGKPFDLNDAGVAFGVRPSEFILHRRPLYELTPRGWDELDWIVLTVGNRNAEDILSRCLFASAIKPRPEGLPMIADIEHSTVILQWPNPQADRPISGSAWPQLAAQRFARKLHNRQLGRPGLPDEPEQRLPSALLHFSEPPRAPLRARETKEPPARAAEMADYLELFAYWQQHTTQNAVKGQPPAWQNACFAANGQGRSVVLGLARAIVEVPGPFNRFLPAKPEPFRIYAHMEAGTRWQWEKDESGKPELVIDVGAWSLNPQLWAGELKCPTSELKIHAQLFGGKVRETLTHAADALVLRWRCAEAGLVSAAEGGIVDTSQIIAAPYDNFLGLLVVVTLPAAVPLKSAHSYE